MLEQVSFFAEGLDHAEGVAVHPDGGVWCGGEAGQIYRIDPSGKNVEEVAHTGGFVLGLAFSPDVSWLAICDAGNKAVMRLELSTMEVSTFAQTIGDWQLMLPNYPVFARDGTLYVSESGDFGKVNGRIFRFDREGNGTLWTRETLNFANGMALDADESYMYLVETFSSDVSRFRINADGSVGPRELYVDDIREVPDGLAFDVEGNLYCSCYAPSRIYRIDPHGRTSVLVEDITCHMLSNCTNIAFGGPEFKTLLITNLGRWHVSQLPMNVRGLPLSCHAEQ